MQNDEIGIDIQSTCYACLLSDARCSECQDELDARDTDRAWEIVDEGNLQYRYTLSQVTEPSGHDWTSAVTRRQKPAILMDGTLNEFRVEYANPSHKLVDGMDDELALHLNLAELDDETQRAREIQCPWCNLLTPKQFNDCQDCDRPLENNVR